MRMTNESCRRSSPSDQVTSANTVSLEYPALGRVNSPTVGSPRPRFSINHRERPVSQKLVTFGCRRGRGCNSIHGAPLSVARPGC